MSGNPAQHKRSLGATKSALPGELMQYIAPLVQMDEKDEFAKRFDNFMYGLMLANMVTRLSKMFSERDFVSLASNPSLCSRKNSKFPQ